jgi:C4-dicarboxylate-specific signal transduction histidine kinase
VRADERTLVVAVQAADGSASLTVRDSGPGIPTDALPHLFEPFFTTRKEGLGLGLSLCESLAAGMNGTLSAENIAPHGAAFRLRLPLAPSP